MSSKFDRSSKWATFVFWLVKKLSRQITSCDCSTSRSQRCEPRKPAPPVTKMRLICAMRAEVFDGDLKPAPANGTLYYALQILSLPIATFCVAFRVSTTSRACRTMKSQSKVE